ncbi:TPA: hypothetical protein EYN23_09115 [Candidatus Poribacteria bacterium]|nr:hypothetical protein [Candidatus Poribacteria bacterium]
MKLFRYGLFSSLICFLLSGHLQVLADAVQPTATTDRAFLIYSIPHLQNWSITNKIDKTQTRLTQISIPWTAQLWLSNRTRMVLTQSSAISEFNLDKLEDQDKSELTLQGMGDIRLKIKHQLLDSLMVIAGTNFPTGKTGIDPETDEEEVLKHLFNDALDFQTGRLGEGWAFDIGTAYARQLAGITFGIGANYLYKNTYLRQLLNDPRRKVNYNPGTDISFTSGFSAGSVLQFHSDFTYIIHTRQTIRGTGVFDKEKNYFEQGPDLLVDGGITYKRQRLQLDIFGQLLDREDSSRPDVSKNNRLEIVDVNQNNRRRYVLRIMYQTGGSSTISATVEDKLLEDQNQERVASILSYYLDSHFQLANPIGLTFGLKISNGKMNEGQTRLSGYGCYAALTTGF